MRRVFAFFTLAPLQLVPAALALDARSDAYELMLVCRLVELRGGVPPRFVSRLRLKECCLASTRLLERQRPSGHLPTMIERHVVSLGRVWFGVGFGNILPSSCGESWPHARVRVRPTGHSRLKSAEHR